MSKRRVKSSRDRDAASADKTIYSDSIGKRTPALKDVSGAFNTLQELCVEIKGDKDRSLEKMIKYAHALQNLAIARLRILRQEQEGKLTEEQQAGVEKFIEAQVKFTSGNQICKDAVEFIRSLANLFLLEDITGCNEVEIQGGCTIPFFPEPVFSIVVPWPSCFGGATLDIVDT